jgi:ABC-type lipoprotein export system ATPase subunit
VSAAPCPSPTGARVVANGLRREYPGPVVAVDDVSLTLEPGEVVALTGPSGSGKTTLLSLLGALEEPDTGWVEVDGLRVSDHRGDRSAYHHDVVGFVFQHHFLLGHLSARTNVELPLIGGGMRRRPREERADGLLEEVGVGHRLGTDARVLSGGERQRVAVARALANDPTLLLADEPTGSLDSDAADQVLALIEDVRRRRGTTVLLVTHDPGIAERADRVLHMRDGRVIADGGSALRAEQLCS